MKFNFNSMKFKFNSISIQFQFKFNSNSIQIQFKFNSNSIQIQFKFNSNSIQIQFKFNSNSIQIQFKFNSSSIQVQFNTQSIMDGTSGDSPKLLPSFYRILANKMEANLRNLANSLGECSRLVSQVLASSSSSSNTNVTDSVTRVTDSRVVSENNLSSTNVSSAVQRARSMLQRSQSSGLCTRLNQRERLRAASPSSVPAGSGAKKQKTTQEPKPFEFALVYVEDGDEENQENLAINHDNIVLRGFVNLSTTDGEAEIRSKIGDAIRLKYPLVGNRDFVFLRANRRRLSTPVSCEEYTYKQVKLLCGQGAIYIKLKSELNCLICDDDANSSAGDEDLPGNIC